MTKKTIPIITPFLIKECAYCQKEFTRPDCQKQNYRLLNQSDIPAAEPGIFLLVLHKACWTEYQKGLKKAWEQIKNDPIYRWSRGDWTKNTKKLEFTKKSKLFTTAEYLRKLGYSVQENIYNKNQVGDLSLKELEKKIQKSEARQKFLTTQFQKISDVELIDELKKRVSQQDIKLSIYPSQEHIFIIAKDMIKEVSFPLPIEIKSKE